MSLSEDFLAEDMHPIDIVETLAEHHAWEFDRVTDDQIAMSVEGQWRTYSLTLAWSLCLAGGQVAGPEQIDRLISAAVMAAERFYPAFQLVTWADHSPADAIKVAIAEAYGRA